MPHLKALEQDGPAGEAYLSDFRKLDLDEPVDAVITSPPFSKSIRFWTSNWMRLWFAGWTPADFKQEPNKFLEVEQRNHFDAYGEFAESMARVMKPGGLLVMHLGETATVNMATSIQPLLSPHFDIRFVGRESVTGHRESRPAGQGVNGGALVRLRYREGLSYSSVKGGRLGSGTVTRRNAFTTKSAVSLPSRTFCSGGNCRNSS